MVIIGLLFLFFGGIYFMFWASYKIMTWIPFLLLGIFMTIDFILDHWIISLIIYTVFAAITFFAISDEIQDNLEKND